MSTIYIETSRLVLRQWKESDREPYALLNADKEVMEFFPSTLTPDESLAQINRISAHIDKNNYGFFAVERKDNDQFIGLTGLSNPGFEVDFNPCVEIGWRLSKGSWGQGFATEAAKACLDYGFDVLCIDEIVSFTSIHNKRSEQVMKRIGMIKAGLFDHPLIAEGHILKKHLLYKISRQAMKL